MDAFSKEKGKLLSLHRDHSESYMPFSFYFGENFLVLNLLLSYLLITFLKSYKLGLLFTYRHVINYEIKVRERVFEKRAGKTVSNDTGVFQKLFFIFSYKKYLLLHTIICSLANNSQFSATGNS